MISLNKCVINKKCKILKITIAIRDNDVKGVIVEYE